MAWACRVLLACPPDDPPHPKTDSPVGVSLEVLGFVAGRGAGSGPRREKTTKLARTVSIARSRGAFISEIGRWRSDFVVTGDIVAGGWKIAGGRSTSGALNAG